MNQKKKKIKGKLHISENNTIPAVKIGRFAIDEKYSQKGLGSYILRNVLLNLSKIAETEIGIRFVIVDGYASAFNFYVTNNFDILKKDEKYIKNIDEIIKRDPNRTFLLYLDLKEIEKNSPS